MAPSGRWRRRSGWRRCLRSSPCACWFGGAPPSRVSISRRRRLTGAYADQLLQVGDDWSGRFDSNAFDQRFRDVGQHVVQIAQVRRALDAHDQKITAKPQMLVDKVGKASLRDHELLSLVFAPWCRRGSGARLGWRAEAFGDEPGALERRDRLLVHA